MPDVWGALEPYILVAVSLTLVNLIWVKIRREGGLRKFLDYRIDKISNYDKIINKGKLFSPKFLAIFFIAFIITSIINWYSILLPLIGVVESITNFVTLASTILTVIIFVLPFELIYYFYFKKMALMINSWRWYSKIDFQILLGDCISGLLGREILESIIKNKVDIDSIKKYKDSLNVIFYDANWKLKRLGNIQVLETYRAINRVLSVYAPWLLIFSEKFRWETIISLGNIYQILLFSDSYQGGLFDKSNIIFSYFNSVEKENKIMKIKIDTIGDKFMKLFKVDKDSIISLVIIGVIASGIILKLVFGIDITTLPYLWFLRYL